MTYNSTIRPKMGICPLCSDTKKKPLTKGLCSAVHYWQQNRLKSALKAQEKELQRDEDLQTLVSDLDIIFSRYIRLKEANVYGDIECYTCGKLDDWKTMQCGHFIPRAHMYTRFSEQNCKPQCVHCNTRKSGNLVEFAKHLESDNPGSVEILQEQARIVHHYSRVELKGLIAEYDRKLKKLQKSVLK